MATREEKPFERVWKLVARIPRGRVATYGQLSELIDRRLTPLGIAWALRAVPEGALPWHRIVNSSGGISTNAEVPGVQRRLLEAEGVVFDSRGKIDLARFGWKPRTEKKRTAKKPTDKKRRR